MMSPQNHSIFAKCVFIDNLNVDKTKKKNNQIVKVI